MAASVELLRRIHIRRFAMRDMRSMRVCTLAGAEARGRTLHRGFEHGSLSMAAFAFDGAAA